MIKAPALAICVVLSAAVALPALAQTMPKRNPGLWEAQMTTGGANVPNMQEHLASMSPEQRAQMEAV